MPEEMEHQEEIEFETETVEEDTEEESTENEESSESEEETEEEATDDSEESDETEEDTEDSEDDENERSEEDEDSESGPVDITGDTVFNIEGIGDVKGKELSDWVKSAQPVIQDYNALVEQLEKRPVATIKRLMEQAKINAELIDSETGDELETEKESEKEKKIREEYEAKLEALEAEKSTTEHKQQIVSEISKACKKLGVKFDPEKGIAPDSKLEDAVIFWSSKDNTKAGKFEDHLKRVLGKHEEKTVTKQKAKKNRKTPAPLPSEEELEHLRLTNEPKFHEIMLESGAYSKK